MKRFILYGEMADLFCKEIELRASTMREAIEGLSANFPKFRSYFINKLNKGIHYHFVCPDKNSMEMYCLDMPLIADEYDILPSVEGSAAGAAAFAGNALLGYGMSWLSDKLTPKEPPENEIITTNSFIYSNNENRAEQGTPVPVVYGQLRVGSKVIHSSIHNYDYDYDAGSIHEGKPINTRLSRLIGGADYNFINPTDITDLRAGTSESFKGLKDFASDITKRFAGIGVSMHAGNGTKNLSSKLENEAMNEVFENDKKSSNKKMHFGPSEKTATYTDAQEDWWDIGASKNARPFLYPIAGSIDINMRPAGPTTLSVERESKAGLVPVDIDEKCLSFVSPRVVSTVGTRTAYNKLESIGIHKSLDIISEGPIAGLANPITGLDADNGLLNYPYSKADPVRSTRSALVQNIDYANLQTSNFPLVISNAGSDYPNGVYNKTGNDQSDSSFFITIKGPSSLKSASIQDSSFFLADQNNNGLPDNTVFFKNNIATTEPLFFSNNRIFLLSSGDGRICLNDNDSNTINGSLPAVYTTAEDPGAGVTGVIDLAQLESDSNILPGFNSNFKIGKGYGSPPAGLTYNIPPHNESLEYDVEIEKLSSSKRISNSEVMDYGYFFLDRQDNPTFQNEFNVVHNSTALTIPRTNLNWSASVRNSIYSTAFNANSSITIVVGTWSQQVRSNGRWVTQRNNVSLTITMQQYIDCSNVTAANTNGAATATPGFNSWNNDQASTTNEFQNLVTGSVVPLGFLLRNAAFANTVFNQFNNQAGNTLTSITIPAVTITRAPSITPFQSGGGMYLKFGPGSGSNTASGTTAAGWTTPSHMLEVGLNNFTTVSIMNDGAIPEDLSLTPRGFYCPMLHPRITVFVLRKTTDSMGSSFRFLPTNIDAVATISATGTVSSVNLLRVPDLPVYESTFNGGDWTPILVNSSTDTPVVLFPNSPDFSYQDLGYYCQIDPSNAAISADFEIDNETLTHDALPGGSRRHLCTMEANWNNHISRNSITPGRTQHGAGIFPSILNNASILSATPTIAFNIEADNKFNTPTATATAQVTVESINLAGTDFLINTLINPTLSTASARICTGRPASLTVLNAGTGYTLKSGNANGSTISQDIYNFQYGIKKFDLKSTGNKGYKPDQTFYAYGVSRTKNLATLGVIGATPNNAVYNSCKLKISTDNTGSISDIEILDPGFGFSTVLDPDDFIFSNDSQFFNNLPDAAFLAGSSTEFIDPAIHFLKQDLIVSVANNHLNILNNEGSISKFYISQEGLGFNRFQDILDPFSSISFNPPVFQITIVNGSIASILVQNPGSGYSNLDSSIKITISDPPAFALPQVNNAAIDPDSWARSIYLNDVPMRDKNGMFNFSKFHFDIRIGHGKNGLGESNLIPSQVNLIAPGSRPNMISSEFKLPSYTKVIDYPLYGPRNENEKDYYYAHTIKNPEVSVIGISINIKELHYTYEGDEAALYVNLIPLMMAGVGYLAAKAMKDAIKAAFIQDPISLYSKGMGSGTGVGACMGAPIATQNRDGGQGMGSTVAKVGEMAKAGIMIGIAASILAGAVGLVLAYLLVKIFPCRKIPWLCFKIGEIIKNSGEIWPAKVRIAIEYGVEGETLEKDVISFNGCATNEYVKDVLIENLPKAEGSSNNFKNRIVKVYRTTRSLDPISGGIVEARYKIQTSLHSITEYVEGFFSYPNTAIIGTRVNSKDFPQQPKKEFLIKGRMIRVPHNYTPSIGTYNGDWDGNWKYIDSNADSLAQTSEILLEWTSNPAWIIFDLLTNERYGMGKYGIKESDIDAWSFYTFSKFCDEKVDVVIDGVKSSERRHMCNLYIDSERQAYDYIKDLMYIYNSSISFNGGKIYITTDSSVLGKNESIMIFNNSNVDESGFSYSSTPETSRITSATVDYLDERDNYMQKSEYVEDGEGVKEHGYSHIKIAGMGVTRRGEAHRLAWHKILTKQLEKEIIQFKTGLQGSYLRIGDVIDVLDNHKIEKHSGGRITRIVSATEIEIDIPAAAIASSSLLLEVPISSDSDSDTIDSSNILNRRSSQFKEYSISIKQNFSITFSSPIDPEIVKGLIWIIKEDAASEISPKKYRVKEIKESSAMNFEIIGTEYLEGKYDQIDKSSSSKDGILLEEREYYGHNIIV